MDEARADLGDLAFAWYFVDLSLEDGSRATVALHAANGFALPRRASTIVWRYEEGKKPRLWTVPGGRPRLPAATMYRGLSNDVSEVRPTAQGWSVSIDAPNTRLALNIRQTVPVWRPSTLPFPLRYEEATGNFEWVIVCPHGLADGTLELDGTIHRVTGGAYIDTNYGTIDLAAELDWWKWSCIELGAGHRLIVSSTKWRRQPLTHAAVQVSSEGVREMPVDEAQRELRIALDALRLEAPVEPKGLTLSSELPLARLGARIERYRRWSGEVDGRAAVLALLTTESPAGS
jgi:hypothetical protein